MRKLFIILLLPIILTGTAVDAIAATNFDPEGHAKLPITGETCSKSGNVVKNAVYQFTCESQNGSLVWSGTELQYKSPANYLKGYAIGQALKKDNSDGENAALICRNTADGKVVRNYQVQIGIVSAAIRNLLNEYYGFMGCWDGYNSTKKAPSTISLPDPVGPIFSIHGGQQINISDGVLSLFHETAQAFNDGTENGVNWISSNQTSGGFDQDKISLCADSRIKSNWTITSLEPDLRTLSYNYGADSRFTPDPASGFDSGRKTADPYTQTPLRVFVWETYQDDEIGEFATANWRRVVVNNDGSLAYNLSQCPTEDESTLPKLSTWQLPIAPKQITAPTGKVDKASNAYKTMYTVGQNFAKVSLASDTARSQCLSAMATGMIKNRGIPQYLGMQARQLQSYLSTASGFQGCIDGFGH